MVQLWRFNLCSWQLALKCACQEISRSRCVMDFGCQRFSVGAVPRLRRVLAVVPEHRNSFETKASYLGSSSTHLIQ